MDKLQGIFVEIEKLDVGYILRSSENSKQKRIAIETFERMIVQLKEILEPVDCSKSLKYWILPSDEDKSLKETETQEPKDAAIFQTIDAFESDENNRKYAVGKSEVEITPDRRLRLYNRQYKINIFTTITEIKRLQALPEELKTQLLRAFGQTAYASKAIVLRRFLEDLGTTEIS